MKRATGCLGAVLTVMLASLWSGGSDADSLYVSDQIQNTVTKFDAVTGAFQGVFITAKDGGMVGPNGIVVNPVAPPQLVVANQNVGLPVNGDIRVFDEGSGALKSILVPDDDKHGPSAPFGILLYGNSLLIADEAGQVEVFDVTKTPARFAGNLDTTSYNKKPFHPFGMVVGPDGRLYVGTRSGQPGVPGDVIRFDLAKSKFIDVFVSGEGCLCSLDRPSGVVFGHDQRLYVTSSRPPPSQNPPMGDTDKILVFNGTTGVFVDRIDLDMAGSNDRSVAPALLFGPGGLLYLTIAQVDASGVATGVGSIRKYNVTNKQFEVIVQPNTTLKLPTLFTFGSTNPTTLAYGN